jgi:hypothetical protein
MENFTFTFNLDNKENNTENNTSFRKKDYKATSFTKTREEKQEERRKKILEEQRQKRNSLVNQARKLIELSIRQENGEDDSDSDSDFEIPNQVVDTTTSSSASNNNMSIENNENGMEIDKKTKKNKNKNKKKNKYRKDIKTFKNQLMISEKLMEIPEDFQTNWISVKVPDGIPCLVISYNGKTVSRRDDGTIIETFYSNIPGGNPLSRDFQNYSILDCMYCEEVNTYYIKDIMCWKGYPTYDCEAEFRFFWIQTKVNEIDLKTCNRYNQHSFIPLPACYCQPNELIQFLNANDDNLTSHCENIIGPIKPPSTILFYNKESHYILGSTPLCCHLTIDEAKTLLKDYCSTMEI